MSSASPIVEVLRERLSKAGESLGEIARQTGVDKATLSRFLSGQNIPSGPRLDALALYFGLELRPKRRNRKGH